jgi:hypothetical protein
MPRGSITFKAQFLEGGIILEGPRQRPRPLGLDEVIACIDIISLFVNKIRVKGISDEPADNKHDTLQQVMEIPVIASAAIPQPSCAVLDTVSGRAQPTGDARAEFKSNAQTQ